jgi:Tfp pilus assembly protein PilN
MLNKRSSDILFILLLVIVVVGVFGFRFLILSQMDSRIESTERNNQQLQAQINSIERLVSENRNEQLPSMIEMHQIVPAKYDRDQLLLYIQAQLELSGIPNNAQTQRNVIIGNNPTTFPQGTPLRELSNDVDLYTVLITFRADDLTELQLFIDNLFNSNQTFLIQSVEYDLTSTGQIPVTIAIAAVYAK